MVTIHRQGRIRDTIRTVCQKCFCEFSFARNEAELVHDNRDGDYYAIKCPGGCGRTVTIDRRLVQ